ncbi:PepSY domain-containing protein [Streptomyces mirabilis]|uniref:PepSY domain-containing protein n=1 Tax=Streptomyces mirabilis TaxID=68239 RepID=UPI00382DD90F
MKRTPMILVTAGALAVTVTGTALAGGGSHDVPLSRNASSIVTATPTAPPTTPNTLVSSSRAAEIAVGHVGGGQVIEVEPEVEHGRTAWSVRILKNGSRHKVYVDRSNGRIMRASRSRRATVTTATTGAAPPTTVTTITTVAATTTVATPTVDTTTEGSGCSA